VLEHAGRRTGVAEGDGDGLIKAVNKADLVAEVIGIHGVTFHFNAIYLRPNPLDLALSKKIRNLCHT